MKKSIVVLFVILYAGNIFGQNISLLESYKIPTVSFGSLSLYGENFLNWIVNNSLGDGSRYEQVNMEFGVNGSTLYQTPLTTRKINGNFSYYYNLNRNTHPNFENTSETAYCNLRLNLTNDFYLENEKGMFLFVNPGLYYEYLFNQKKGHGNADLEAGAGYGRVYAVTEIVKAYIINDELELGMTDGQLVKLAEIIERHNIGEYNAKYRDNENIEFYKDIAKITGKPELESKISQIVFSNLYKTAARYLGWKVMGGIHYYRTFEMPYHYYMRLSSDESSNNSYDLFAGISYAVPLSFNKQLILSGKYYQNLDENFWRMPRVKLNADFSIDHNYNWSSTISLFGIMAIPKGHENIYNYGLTIKSELTILNRFSLYSNFNYTKLEFDDYDFNYYPSTILFDNGKTERMQLNLGFRFRIF